MLPDTDGLEIMRRLRADQATATVPIMMLTAKDSELDKVVALDGLSLIHISRVTSKLLAYLGISKPLVRCDENVIARRAPCLLYTSRCV